MWNSNNLQKANALPNSWQIGSDSEDSQEISSFNMSSLPNQARENFAGRKQNGNQSNSSMLQAVLGAMKFSKRRGSRACTTASQHGTPINTRSKSPSSKRHAWSNARHKEMKENASTHQVSEDDISCRISDGPTYLFKMAEKGRVKEIATVVNAQPERLLSRDEKGASLLHHAAGNGQIRVMDFVLSDQDGGQLLDEIDELQSTPLHRAVANNNADAVDYLLSRGANPHLTNARGESPLHESVRLNVLHALRALIKHKGIVDVNHPSKISSSTAMHVAAEYDHDEAAKLLMDAGAKICKPCQQGYRPLHVAALNGSKKVMKILIEKCAEYGYTSQQVLSSHDKELCSPLHCAVLGGDSEAIKMCLGYGARLDTQQADMTTPMHLVCAQGAFDIVEIMFEFAEEQATRTLSMQDKQKHAPLHKAAMYGHASIVGYLAKHGADLDILDADENTPMLLAASRGNWSSVRNLIESGASMMIKNKWDRNFLHMIVLRGGDIRNLELYKFDDKEIIQKTCTDLLCKPEIQQLLNQADTDGCTPLHYACQEGNLASLDTLMMMGVSARLKSSGNLSPLHFAAQYGRYNACIRLISSPQGPNIINEKDDQGMTPLHYAAENGHFKIVQLLLNKGAVCHRNVRGESVLHVSASSGYTKTIKILVDMNITLLDSKDEEGNTALHHAGVSTQVSTVKLLLDLQARIQRNDSGHTFFTHAIQNQNREISLTTITHDRWEDAMQEFYKYKESIYIPSLLLIQYLPDVWVTALNRCVHTADCSQKSKDYWIKYQFKYLQPNVDKRDEIKRKLKEILSSESNNGIKSINGNNITSSSEVEQEAFTLPALNKMVQYNRVECLRHPVSTAYLDMKWKAYGSWFHGLNLFIYMMGILPLTYLICTTNPAPRYHNEYRGSINDTHRLNEPVEFNKVQLSMMILLSVLSFGQLIKEIVQIFQQKNKYFRDAINLFEWVLYASCLLYVIPFYAGYPIHWQFEFGAIAVFLAWFNLLWYLQRFDIAGIYVVMFFVILRTLMKVLALFSFLIIAFSLSFFILMEGEGDHSFSTPGLSIMRIITMTLGEINYVDMFLSPYVDNDDDTLHYSLTTMFLLVWFIVVMPILLMNLLIGLAVGDIAEVQSNAELQRLAMQVQLHTEIEGRLSTRILKLVDKDELIIYPNKRCGGLGKIFGKIISRSESISDKMESPITLTDRSINHLNIEVQKQKERLKEIQISMTKQHDLLRLIVQKMEIRSEAEVQDEGSCPDIQRRSQASRNRMPSTIRHKLATANAFKTIIQK